MELFASCVAVVVGLSLGVSVLAWTNGAPYWKTVGVLLVASACALVGFYGLSLVGILTYKIIIGLGVLLSGVF